MLEMVFKALFIPSFAGSALAALILLMRPMTKKCFGYLWHYYIWLCVLLVLLLPVRLDIRPKSEPVAVPTWQEEQSVASDFSIIGEEETKTVKPVVKPTLQTVSLVWGKMTVLSYVWLVGVGILMLLNALRYIRLHQKIWKRARPIVCPQIQKYTDREIKVLVWEDTTTPFLTGVFKPKLLLPDVALSDEQLCNILNHEMVHFLRRDILYKWFAELVKCVHWLNPMVWYVSGQIAAECEISCDLLATKGMSDHEKESYMETILYLLQRGTSKRLLFTTQMANGKKTIR